MQSTNSPLSELSYNFAQTQKWLILQRPRSQLKIIAHNRMRIHNNVCARLQSLECKFIAKRTRRYDNSTICAH